MCQRTEFLPNIHMISRFCDPPIVNSGTDFSYRMDESVDCVMFYLLFLFQASASDKLRLIRPMRGLTSHPIDGATTEIRRQSATIVWIVPQTSSNPSTIPRLMRN